MKLLKNNKGFTLIELILVIAILGILAIAVLPQFVDITTSAHEAQRDGVVGAVRSGISVIYSADLADDGIATWPATLDGAADGACAPGNLCFSSVLQNGVGEAFTKAGQTYTHTATGSAYTYDPATGLFQ